MKPRSLCAMVLALALPAFAQSEPQLEPLVPQNAPWLQKNQKKRATKKAPPKKAAPEQAQKPSLPPLAPLTLPPAASSYGVLVQGAGPGAATATVEEGLRAVARRVPGVAETSPLRAPDPCADEACWVMAGVAAKVDRVLVASFASGALRVRLVDVKARALLSDAQKDAVGDEVAQMTATAEALACKLLVPAGCTGEAQVDAAPGIELEIDGKAVRPGEKRMLPVGVHALRIREGSAESSRPLPVLIEGSAPLFVSGARRVAAAPPPEPAPVAAVTTLPQPAPRRSWTKSAGYVTAGAAVAAVAAGAYFGLKSKSQIDDAESAYRANGNAWTPANLDALHSGNSKAQTANVLFIASGVLLATSAALTFAF